MPFIGPILSFLGSILGWFLGRKEVAGVAQGRAEQTATDEKTAVEGQKRIDQAAARPYDRDSTQKRMDDGTF